MVEFPPKGLKPNEFVFSGEFCTGGNQTIYRVGARSESLGIVAIKWRDPRTGEELKETYDFEELRRMAEQTYYEPFGWRRALAYIEGRLTCYEITVRTA